MKSLRMGLVFAVVTGCVAGLASARAQGILLPARYYAVQNAPFTLTVETRRELPEKPPATDDAPIEDKLGEFTAREGTQRILRDSAGRQRYEGPVVAGASRPGDVAIAGTVVIYDVVAGKRITLDLPTKTASVAPMRLGKPVLLDVTQASSLPPATPDAGSARPGMTQQLLGMKTIAGLEAWGQRTVTSTTRVDGTVVTRDRELWTSTHYGMPLLQVMRGAEGKTTATVVSFAAGEPDAALFRIPDGFQVSEAPAGRRPAPGTMRIGNGVSAPQVLKAGEPEFSEEARKKKISGNVLVHLIVDEQGLPQDVTVVRGMGYGMDEKAVKAVKEYRFRPAMKDGVPVKVEVNVQVNFEIFTKPRP